MVTKILAAWYKLCYRKSLIRAIRHANHVKNTTGHKCLVLFFPKGYKAVTKQAVKQLVKQHYFKKGATIQKIESMAVYSTN